MQRAFRYLLYPNREQAEAMTGLLETHRRLYNSALAERKSAYESDECTVGYQEQSAHLKTDRKENPYLALANFSSCQRTLKRLDRAFAAFFRRIKNGETAGYPRFRGYGRFDSVEFTHGDGAKLAAEGRAYFQSVGNVKVKMHRPVEGKIKTVTFRRQAGRWYAVFVCDVAETRAEQSENPAVENACVGIDLGLKSFFVTSDGEGVKPPQFYRKAQKKLRRVQRAVSRKRKGGANRRKAVQHLARVHQHVADQRKDWHHKTALSLVRRYGLIAHEDLNVKGIARSKLPGLAKSAHDAGWSQFLSVLRQKAGCAAVLVVGVDPRDTTQTCSHCGCLPAVALELSDRVYHCAFCGLQADRDLNAARNILCRGAALSRAGAPPLGANVGR